MSGTTSLIHWLFNSFIELSTSGRGSWPEFYDEQSTSCAIAIVEGSKAVLKATNIVARAQFPDRLRFHGWVAIDSKSNTYLSDDEAVAIWIHEIGHLLGLRHNPSAASLMFYIVYATNELDSADLRALASLHSFRPIPAIQYTTVDYGSGKEIRLRQALSK